jgi:hypothetical protein
MVLINSNLFHLMFVFSFSSQNTHSPVKVEISTTQKYKCFNVVYEIMFEYFKLPDDGFLKKPKYVEIIYTAIYYQNVVVIHCSS